MNKITITVPLTEALANMERLDKCSGPHVFEGEDPNKRTCRLCGGQVTASMAFWYQTGLKHGRRG